MFVDECDEWVMGVILGCLLRRSTKVSPDHCQPSPRNFEILHDSASCGIYIWIIKVTYNIILKYSHFTSLFPWQISSEDTKTNQLDEKL